MEEFIPVSAARHEPVAARESARPQRRPDVDTTVDVVVVGGGPGGQATALFCAWRGLDVMLLEKAPELGGTGRKAAFACWAPNNRWLRETGVEDPEEDFLRFAARTARPERYDPQSPTFGQPAWEFELLRTIYRSAAEAVELLHDSGALRFQHERVHGEYWPNLPENRVTAGRALFPEGVNETRTNGGPIAMDSLAAAIDEAGVDVRVGHRVQRVIVDDERVTGVVATTIDGSALRVGARVGTVFATGGFTHDQELVDNFLGHPSAGGGAALTNTGDFVRIAGTVGAQLRNMQEAWCGPINLVKSLRRDPTMQITVLRAGDSMICVNYKGERVLNEKLPYNEFVASMQAWDPVACERPNRVMIQIWDEHTQLNSAMPNDTGGSAVLPPDQQDDQIVRGNSLDELAQALTAKLAGLRSHTGDLDPGHGLRSHPAGHHRPVQRLGPRRGGRGLPPRRSRCGAHHVRWPGGRRARQGEPGSLPDHPHRALLRDPACSRHAGHQGWPEDRRRRPRGRRRRRAHPRSVRRRQLRCVALGLRLLGRRRNDRPDPRLRPADGRGAHPGLRPHHAARRRGRGLRRRPVDEAPESRAMNQAHGHPYPSDTRQQGRRHDNDSLPQP